jgi:hypothetical protein
MIAQLRILQDAMIAPYGGSVKIICATSPFIS